MKVTFKHGKTTIVVEDPTVRATARRLSEVISVIVSSLEGDELHELESDTSTKNPVGFVPEPVEEEDPDDDPE